ncbi:hypothetical protein GW17_00022295 [Ensete ventricosum]|nr:hypothetical protein GW17_00022295 [Ensete ventricosum]
MLTWSLHRVRGLEKAFLLDLEEDIYSRRVQGGLRRPQKGRLRSVHFPPWWSRGLSLGLLRAGSFVVFSLPATDASTSSYWFARWSISGTIIVGLFDQRPEEFGWS